MTPAQPAPIVGSSSDIRANITAAQNNINATKTYLQSSGVLPTVAPATGTAAIPVGTTRATTPRSRDPRRAPCEEGVRRGEEARAQEGARAPGEIRMSRIAGDRRSSSRRAVCAALAVLALAALGAPPRAADARVRRPITLRIEGFLDAAPDGVRPQRTIEVRIGREEGDIVFPDDEFMSRRHAVLTRHGNRVRIEDQHSSNGTYVRLRGDRELSSSDVLRVGDQVLRFEP